MCSHIWTHSNEWMMNWFRWQEAACEQLAVGVRQLRLADGAMRVIFNWMAAEGRIENEIDNGDRDRDRNKDKRQSDECCGDLKTKTLLWRVHQLRLNFFHQISCRLNGDNSEKGFILHFLLFFRLCLCLVFRSYRRQFQSQSRRTYYNKRTIKDENEKSQKIVLWSDPLYFSHAHPYILFFLVYLIIPINHNISH